MSVTSALALNGRSSNIYCQRLKRRINPVNVGQPYAKEISLNLHIYGYI